MTAALAALALAAALAAGAWVGRHFTLVSLAAWCAAHPSAVAVLRASLDLDRFHGDVRATVEAALATGEPLYVVARSEDLARGFIRDHDLPPHLVRTVTSPDRLRGLGIRHAITLMSPDDDNRAEALASYVAHAVRRLDGDLVEHPHARRRAVLLTPGEHVVARSRLWRFRLDHPGA